MKKRLRRSIIVWACLLARGSAFAAGAPAPDSGAVAWVVAAFVVPSILVLSDTTVFGTAQRVFICVVLALGLVAGMRLARPNVRVE